MCIYEKKRITEWLEMEKLLSASETLPRLLIVRTMESYFFFKLSEAGAPKYIVRILLCWYAHQTYHTIPHT